MTLVGIKVKDINIVSDIGIRSSGCNKLIFSHLIFLFKLVFHTVFLIEESSRALDNNTMYNKIHQLWLPCHL